MAGRSRSRRAPGRLVVCPTPIGNLEDVTLRVLSALREADVVACEDTRRTRVLLDRYGVRPSGQLPRAQRARAAPRARRADARRGDGRALVSDAGMPLVSDPGFVLVQACVAAGLAVEVLPGAERGAGGAGGQRAAGRDVALRRASCRARRASWRRCCAAAETLVAFESPRRVGASLAVLAALDPERPVAVCRELTKIHEEVVRGTAAELAARYAEEEPRGEVVVVIGGAAEGEADLGRGGRAVRGSSRPAPSRGRRRASSPSSPARAPTRCTAR